MDLSGGLMAFLDLPTILFTFICANLICSIVLFVLWQQNRSRYAGLEFWTISFAANFIGIALIAGRDHIPDFYSMFLGNFLLVVGLFLLYIGLERFLLNRGAPFHLFAFVIIYAIFQAFFIYISPNFEIRAIGFSITLLLFSFHYGWLLFRKVDSETGKTTQNLGVITTAFGLLAITRIFIYILIPSETGLYQSSGYEALLYLIFQLLYIVLTISLFTLVNRRLFYDLENDIKERGKVEKALSLSEEKYSKAFNTSPSAMLISRIHDGRFIEVNDIFPEVTGFSKEEVIGKTSLSLGLWDDPNDRIIFVSELRQNSRVRDAQFNWRNKNGNLLQVELSAEAIQFGNEDCMVISIKDISERKRVEQILNLRLNLWDYSLSHTALQVMEEALAEIEKLTASQISFFHLVEEESNSLTLQAWSRNTLEYFCKTESSGMHYSIDKAGVWVDCIKERKPVIHNDYASLPHKKGMPDGHANVIRELVVPIIEDDRVVSILGIGNKPTDYVKEDVEFVEYIASLVWSIVFRIRADEKIKKLNDRLEKLAMTDELTSLPNRRHFFARGNEEIHRSRRYKTHLSLIMLDIDKFKTINDTYGHEAGDNALKCIAKTLKEIPRVVDLPARLGGEEFGILLPNTKREDAVILAERVRNAIEELHCQREDIPITLTASLGVAALQTDMKNLDDLLRNADSAMYQAKNLGRNRVVLYQ
jgi:diguanylate cyclase (GGDEF)-like protein/PAS domain S-box-containing protein